MSLHSYIIYILCLVAYGQAAPIKHKPIVFMISYDAFGNYYFKLNITNHMKQFREEGVYSPYMRNVFPTKTFTNHFSIATGLYPSDHGVVENSLYDSELGALSYGYDLFHFKKDILPIWTLNEMNGGVSGCMMWPGSDFEYSNVSCTYTQKFNTSISLTERVDTAIQWLTNPDKPANLIMLYSEEPDQTGHRYGPHSEQTLQKVAEVNNLTKYIQDKLVEHNLLDETNVIHVSDHGMIGVTSDYFIDLRKYLENGTYSTYGQSPVLQIVPQKGRENEVYAKIIKAAANNGNFDVYKPDTLLDRWHCKNPRRFGPILASSRLNFAFDDMYAAADFYWRKYHIPFTRKSIYGVHGYDNMLDDMKAYFMAKGPLFKKGHITDPFDNIDLYNLLCSILNINNTPKTNGTLDTVSDTLVTKSSDTPWWVILLFLFDLWILSFLLSCICCFCCKESCSDNSGDSSERSSLLSTSSSE